MRWWLALCLVGGCSLSSIADLDLRECASDEDCAPLNQADRIEPGGCVLWQCSSSRACELRERDDDDDGEVAIACGGLDCDDSSAAARPGGSEVCDGLDNDCNGLVDDSDIEPALETVVAGISDPEWSFVAADWLAYPFPDGVGLDHLALSSPPTALTFVRDERFSSAAFVPGCHSFIELEPQPPTSTPVGTTDETCASHAECDDGVLCNGFETCEPRSPDADAFGCRVGGAPACPSDATCDEDARVCRGLSTELACAPREVAFAPSTGDRAFIAAINDVGCAAGQLRVGLLDADSRSILQRGDERRTASWPSIGECSGATRPAIASLMPNPDRSRLRAQATIAWVVEENVRVVGVWDEEATAGGEPIEWTHGTRVAELEAIVAGAGPAVVATDGTYVVAYPAPEGGAWLHAFDALRDPAEVVSSAPHRTSIDPDGGPRAESDLDLPESVRVLRNRSIRELELAVGPEGRIGMAWTEDEGAFFAEIVGETIGRIERIGAGGAELALLGFDRGVVGMTHADISGGWVATWVEMGIARFRRVDVSGIAVDVPRSMGIDVRVPHPFVDASGGLRMVFHAGDQAAFVRSEGLCGLR